MAPLPYISQIAGTRKRLGVRQEELARESKVSQSLISKIESRQVVPTYDNAKMIMDALERIELEKSRVNEGRGEAKKRRKLPLLDAIRNCNGRIGIVDTTFSVIDSASIATNEIHRLASKVKISKYTVPGVRDIPLACKILIERGKCDIVLATGMLSSKGIEKQIENQSVIGIILVELLTNKHIITAFFDENESGTRKKCSKSNLYEIVLDRVRKHAQNALRLLAAPEVLSDYAGLGLRQGKQDVGRLRRTVKLR